MQKKYLLMLVLIGFAASAIFSKLNISNPIDQQRITCDANQVCEWSFANHDYRLQLPKQLYSMQSQVIEIVTTAPDAQLSIKLEGINMYMGEMRFAFESKSNQLYQAQVLIPACSEEIMTWKASIENSAIAQWPNFTFEVQSR